MYNGKVLRNDSFDPTYKIKFSFKDENFEISEGEATFIRQSPLPKVTFCDFTDYVMEKHSICQNTVKNIELEIGKTVFEYIVSNARPQSHSRWGKTYIPQNNSGDLADEESKTLFVESAYRKYVK